MTEFERTALADDAFVLTLWAWGAQIDLAPYADGLDVAAMMYRWHEGRRLHVMPTLADEVFAVEQEFGTAEQELREQHQQPAWIPDDTWPITHEEMRHQQAARATARRSRWHPPTAA